MTLCSSALREGTREFILGMKKRARYFRLVVETVSPDSVTFLDVEISKHQGKVIAQPAWKKTSFTIPLEPASAHPPHVHRSWPTSLIQRLGGISSSSALAQEAKRNLTHRYTASLTHPFTISCLSAAQPWSTAKRSNRICSNGSTLWLRFGYHPAIHRRVCQAISHYTQSHSFLVQHIFPRVRIQVAWYNALPNLVNRVRRSQVGAGG